MKKVFVLVTSLALLHCHARYQPTQQPLKVIELSGSAYNRGFIHGQTLQREIRQIISQWSKATEAKYGLPLNDIKDDFLRQTDYVEAIKKWTPELLDEIKGIADGTGIDFDLIYLLQISEELDNCAPHPDMFRCTSVSVNKTDNSPTIVAQNMEPPRFLHGFPTLLHIKHENAELESYVFTFPGFIGLNGLNNYAIGVTANGLPDYYAKSEGLPVSFVIRGILEKSTIIEALDFIHKIDHAKAQCYTIGGQDSAVCIECDAEHIFRFIPSGHPRLTYHTNHYLAADYPAEYCSRLATIKEELLKRNYRIGYEDIKAILSSNTYNAGRPICHFNTYGCTIMVLSKKPELHITPGRPDQVDFLMFDFNSRKH
ncbi:hypothetical protein JW960_04445 [candidate division KSB1 bacterium]|nr:hypothetical protein [candidate division KSB1 bacterium]